MTGSPRYEIDANNAISSDAVSLARSYGLQPIEQLGALAFFFMTGSCSVTIASSSALSSCVVGQQGKLSTTAE